MDNDTGDNPYEPGQVDVATQPSATTARVLLWVALALLLIDLYLLVGIVPKFKTMFDALGGELPYLTVLVLGLSNFIVRWILPLMVLLTVGWWLMYRHAARIPLIIHIPVLAFLAVTLLSIVPAIQYPILQLQSAVRGEQPAEQPANKPVEPR